MKNSKIIFSGVMAMILATGAQAATTGIASKDYVDRGLNTKIGADAIVDMETKTSAAATYAPKATTLAGYGITDAYTKGEVYNKDEVDGKVAEVVGGEGMSEVLKDYAKTAEVDQKLGTKVDTTIYNADKATFETVTGAAGKYADIAIEATVDTAAGNAAKALTNIGTVGTLATEKKDNLVNAVNELHADAVADRQAWGTSTSGLSDRINGVESSVTTITATLNDEEDGLAAVKTLATGANSAAGAAATAAAEAKTAADAAKNLADSNATALSNKVNQQDLNLYETKANAAATYATEASLGALAKAAPGACSDATNKCVLTFDGTTYAWEVVAR